VNEQEAIEKFHEARAVLRKHGYAIAMVSPSDADFMRTRDAQKDFVAKNCNRIERAMRDAGTHALEIILVT
jgi:hypothetical protein